MFVRHTDSRWSSKRATLLGDAAHLMPPTLGQGANQAIEDARCLASCISDSASDDPLGQYARIRSVRTAEVVLAAQTFYRLQTLKGKALCAARDWVMQHSPARLARRQMRRNVMGLK